jgi:hypothetical protein
MSSTAQKPIVGIGHKFPAGTVVAIKNNEVLLDTAEGVKVFSFTQIEGFINDERTVSQA